MHGTVTHENGQSLTVTYRFLVGETPGMKRAAPVGLIVTPGVGGHRDQAKLVEMDRAVTRVGMVVERVGFPGQEGFSNRKDPPEVCIQTVCDATTALAERLEVDTGRLAIGGCSLGGRMCSLAAAQGLTVSALVLVSYPLHPPGRPDEPRTAHFPDLELPCLFVSGQRDVFGSPVEFERETSAIPGPVTLVFLKGGHSLRRRDSEVAVTVAQWLSNL